MLNYHADYIDILLLCAEQLQPLVTIIMSHVNCSYEWNVPINVATAATSNWDNLLPSFYINAGQSCEYASAAGTSHIKLSFVTHKFVSRAFSVTKNRVRE